MFITATTKRLSRRTKHLCNRSQLLPILISSKSETGVATMPSTANRPNQSADRVRVRLFRPVLTICPLRHINKGDAFGSPSRIVASKAGPTKVLSDPTTAYGLAF